MTEAWSVNRLADLLECDRRTLTRRVRSLAPVELGPNGPRYSLRDVLRLLRQDGRLPDPWQAVDRAVAAFAETATRDLDTLAERLSATDDPAVVARLLRELVADALYRGCHAANPATPSPPDWTRAPSASFDRAFHALCDPDVALDEVVELLEGNA